MLEKIKLETRDGKHVAWEYIMGMGQPPEAILWGERPFILHHGSKKPMRPDDAVGDASIYRECLMIPIPTPEHWLKHFKKVTTPTAPPLARVKEEE